MAEAFVYMYVLGAGASSGVATVGLIVYKLLNRTKKTKKKGIV